MSLWSKRCDLVSTTILLVDTIYGLKVYNCHCYWWHSLKLKFFSIIRFFFSDLFNSNLFSFLFWIVDIWIWDGEGRLISWFQTSFVEDYLSKAFIIVIMYVFRMGVFTAIFQLLGIRHLYIAIQMWPHFVCSNNLTVMCFFEWGYFYNYQITYKCNYTKLMV